MSANKVKRETGVRICCARNTAKQVYYNMYNNIQGVNDNNSWTNKSIIQSLLLSDQVLMIVDYFITIKEKIIQIIFKNLINSTKLMTTLYKYFNHQNISENQIYLLI